jgi:hypothetical protein
VLAIPCFLDTSFDTTFSVLWVPEKNDGDVVLTIRYATFDTSTTLGALTTANTSVTITAPSLTPQRPVRTSFSIPINSLTQGDYIALQLARDDSTSPDSNTGYVALIQTSWTGRRWINN